MTDEYLPVPVAPWVATSTNEETHLFPEPTMGALSSMFVAGQLSPFWKDAYVSPSPLDRVPIITATEVSENGFVQEPQVYQVGDTLHMIYTGGSSLHHAQCDADADPTDPASWTKTAVVLGGGVGGQTGVADHAGVYIEGTTIYLYYRDPSGGLSVATASTSTPTVFTKIQAVLSPPSGVDTPLANPHLIKRGTGDYLFYFEGKTTTPLWDIGIAYGTTPLGPFTGGAMDLTGLGSINPGYSTASNPFIVAEDGGYTMWFHSAWGQNQRGSGIPTAGYVATSTDGLDWTVSHGGQQTVRLAHPAEVDQVADFSLLDLGEEKFAFWSANTQYTDELRVGKIMATRVRRPLAREGAAGEVPLDAVLPAGPVLPTPYLGYKRISPAFTTTTGQADVTVTGLSFEDITLPDTVRATWGVNLNLLTSAQPAYMTVTVQIVSTQPLAGGQDAVVTNCYLVTANQPFPVSLTGAFSMQAGIEFSLLVKVKNGRGDSPTTTVPAGGTSWIDTRKVP